jgi:N-acetylneuraminic acid mutarotase
MLSGATPPALQQGREIPLVQEIRWQELPVMSVARSSLASVAYEKNIYAVGGETLQGVTGSLESYHTDNGRWTQLSPKPEPVAEISAAVIGGLIYVPGGRLPSGERTSISWKFMTLGGIVGNSANLYQYRLAPILWWPLKGGYMYSAVGMGIVIRIVSSATIRAWMNGVNCPVCQLHRAFTGAAVIGSKIYVLGGRNETGPLSVNEIFSPSFEASSDLAWQAGPVLPSKRSGMAVTSTADIIHIIGGSNEAGTGLAFFAVPA